ncbi:hypothetical protein [Nocardioides sp. B-3]|uniref:hypothetical protein n=1 Tax=Nocardioides sp. B-3 TaxID=2895565 RepID=UPI00215330FE|nr:hypothetical protein [Nocardioides sp. B-3]UUZ58595.1 hypothetical protein LP418_20925 [Nocardioides sp. B-3]
MLAVVPALAFTGEDPPDRAIDGPTAQPSQPTTTDPSPTTPPADTTREVTDFITTYPATVTSDRRAAFAMLTPQFRADSGGFGGYSRFWRTIASADPSAIEVDPEKLTVSYEVDYRTVSGDGDWDTVSLQLERTDTGYLIAGES